MGSGTPSLVGFRACPSWAAAGILLVRPDWALEGVMPKTKPGQHVVPDGGKWAVRKSGSSRASGKFDTQEEAVKNARRIAKKQKTELYVHGRDGKIRQRDSYGNDPYPRRGRAYSD